MRFAARPVGAVSAAESPIRSNIRSMVRTVVVLPVPGPPVSAIIPKFAADETARRCASASFMPNSLSASSIIGTISQLSGTTRDMALIREATKFSALYSLAR